MKPILFNTEMTIATLENRKTQTRRVIRFPSWRLGGPAPASDQIHLDHILGEHAFFKIEPFYQVRIKCPYKAGDILYVRETWAEWDGGYTYRADRIPAYPHALVDRWRPSIHMPKEAARLFLLVTDVKVEHLQDITVGGLQREGLLPTGYLTQYSVMTSDCFEMWKTLWDSTVKPADLERCGWAANPWVWVYGFERCEKPRTL